MFGQHICENCLGSYEIFLGRNRVIGPPSAPLLAPGEDFGAGWAGFTMGGFHRRSENASPFIENASRLYKMVLIYNKKSSHL